MDTTVDALRLFNAATAAVVFGLLVHHGALRYRSYTPDRKALWITFLLYVAVVAYGSAEAFAEHAVEMTIRTPLITAANFVALYTLWRHRDEPFTADEPDEHTGV